MTEPLTVSLDELRRAVSTLLAAIEHRHGETVELDAGFYWTVGPWAAYEFSREPEPTMGDLRDDVESMREMLGREETVVWHDLAHVVGILTRLAALDLPGAA
ncbi:hypothetical protein ABT369_52525 [Dactylosporangium sp. NPDC000244]|uniref:hypothetical protein n=1 Tax=Dactylosporangium sp. NPDC000244 TaxID=3154365 RepID=UPI0033313726